MKNVIIKFKKTFLLLVIIVTLVGGFFVDAVAGLFTNPISYVPPPSFVKQYLSHIHFSDPKSIVKTLNPSDLGHDIPQYKKWIEGFSYEEVLVYKAIMQGRSPDELWQLFAHPEHAQRIKIASALAAVNIKYTHNDESGFAPKRNQFWKDVDAHMPDIRNALSEALIDSVKTGAHNRIPYTLAWLPGQGKETVDLFLWAANHHPDHNVRRSCMYYVTILSQDEEMINSLLLSARHDPSYGVRMLALDLRYRKWIGTLPKVN